MLLISRANQLIGFCMTRAPTDRCVQTDYNTMLKKSKYVKKKLDFRDYFLFPMSVNFREILHLQYKPYTTYMENY